MEVDSAPAPKTLHARDEPAGAATVKAPASKKAKKAAAEPEPEPKPKPKAPGAGQVNLAQWAQEGMTLYLSPSDVGEREAADFGSGTRSGSVAICIAGDEEVWYVQARESTMDFNAMLDFMLVDPYNFKSNDKKKIAAEKRTDRYKEWDAKRQKKADLLALRIYALSNAYDPADDRKDREQALMDAGSGDEEEEKEDEDEEDTKPKNGSEARSSSILPPKRGLSDERRRNERLDMYDDHGNGFVHFWEIGPLSNLFPATQVDMTGISRFAAINTSRQPCD